MSKSNNAETKILQAIFNATTWDGLLENDSSSPVTNFYMRLHTADPGEAGTGSTNEAAFTNYAPVAIPRSALGFTVTGNTVVNADLIEFPESGSSETETHWSLTEGSGAASPILYKGALSSTINLQSGGTIRFAAGSVSITED